MVRSTTQQRLPSPLARLNPQADNRFERSGSAIVGLLEARQEPPPRRESGSVAVAGLLA